MGAAFSNVESLGISFRKSKEITVKFLLETPDIDFDTIDIVIDLCKRNKTLYIVTLSALVYCFI